MTPSKMFLVREQAVPGFDAFLGTLQTYATEITRAFVEELNTPIRVLTRRCFGLFILTLCFQRLWLDLERFRSFPHSWGLPH